MRAVITLRFRSARRVCMELARDEPVALAAVLLVVGLALWRMVGIAGSARGAWFVGAAGGVPALLAHLARDDERFLRDAGVPVAATRAVEYLLLAAPGCALLLVATGPVAAAALPLVASLLLAPLPPSLLRDGWRHRPRQARRVPLVPEADYVTISGVRRRGAVVVLVWLLALALSRVPAMALVLGAVLALTLAEVHGSGEGREFVRAIGGTPAQFLRGRVWRAVALFALAVSPILAMLLVHHAAWWPAALLLLWVGSAAQVGAVLLRFATLVEGRRTGFVDTLVAIASAVAALVPPALVLLLLPLWRRAVRTLVPHLGATLLAPAVAPDVGSGALGGGA